MFTPRRAKSPLLALVVVLLSALLVPGLASTASAATSPSASAPAARTASSVIGAQTSVIGAQTSVVQRKKLTKRAKAKARAAKVRAAKVRAAKVRAAKARAKARAEAHKKPNTPARPTPSPSPAPVPAPSTFRMANANLKYNMAAGSFASDLARVLASSPDVATLNEVAARTSAQLSPAGYGSYRPTDRRIKANAVLWRLDRWTAVSTGQIYLIDDGPQAQDDKRGATWVTLTGRNGQGTVSVISTHHMVNPAKYGPDKPLRQRLYASGMERLKTLVTQLSASGPVFVGGDFNSGFRENVSWSPRTMFASIGVAAAMQSMPYSPTHDQGGTVDYVFYQVSRAVVTAQQVVDLLSDHHLVLNDFALLPQGVQPGAGTRTARG